MIREDNLRRGQHGVQYTGYEKSISDSTEDVGKTGG
jgi:hypothetical protein